MTAAAATTVLIGTQKGLFRLRLPDGTLDGPWIAGYEILHAWLDPRRPGRGFAALRHPVWGAHLYATADDGANWQTLPAPPSHPPGTVEPRLRAVWYLAPSRYRHRLYAGIDPAGLFRSEDGGATWEPVPGINHHPTRPHWEPARGGFSLHSIAEDPHDPRRLYCAVSAGGCFRSDDDGHTWEPINRGVRAEHRPEPAPRVGHNVHRLLVHPAGGGRLYRQCYNGVYRSDDAGAHWVEISTGLPSDFGYPVVSPVDRPDTVFVVPAGDPHMRTAPGGRLRVYRSDDAGATWRALTHGLPQEHAYVTVLRQCLAASPQARILALGTSGGHLFISEDGGEQWRLVAGFLPRITCVSVAVPEGLG